MKRKTLIGIGTIFFISILVIAVTTGKKKKSISESTTAVFSESAATSEAKENNSGETKKKTENAKEERKKGSRTVKDTAQSKQEDSSKVKKKETNIIGIKLPYEIEDTGLVVEKVGAYHGAFVEDGRDKKVKNVLAMTFENKTDQVIQYSNISFRTTSGKTAEFKITMIPAGGKVIAFEQNKMKYKKSNKYELDDQITAYMEPDQVSLLEDQVSIVGTNKNQLTITNLTDATIKVLRIFYKYQYDDGTYVGGITFTSKIKNLKGNDKVTISPDHFDIDGCTVIMAKEYEQ